MTTDGRERAAACLNARKKKMKDRKTHGRVHGADKRAAMCCLRRGSLTVEAAVALPVFFFCVLTLISFLEMFRLSMTNTVRLQQEAEELGRVAAVTGSFMEEIDLYECVPWSAGFSSAFGAHAGIAARAHVRPWVGRPAETPSAGSSQNTGHLVYVTDYQSVYHTDSRCTHLSLSVKPVNAGRISSLRNTYGKKYHACEKCTHTGDDSIVFITSEGDHFHADAECSGLTRTVRMEKLADLQGLHICSRCAAREGG